MALLTVQQTFGNSVSETASTITFLKSELLGLTPQANNTADSILAGIINTAHQAFEGTVTDQNGVNLIDQNGIPITYDNHLYYSATWLQFWGYLLPAGRIDSVFIISSVQPYAN